MNAVMKSRVCQYNFGASFTHGKQKNQLFGIAVYESTEKKKFDRTRFFFNSFFFR